MWGDNIPSKPNSAYTSGPQSKQASSGLSTAGYASLGIGAVSGILSSLSSSKANIENIKSKNNAAIQAIQDEVAAFKAQASIIDSQDLQLDQQLFNKMSQRGLEALKAEARLRAAAAETGTTGGTTDVAVGQAWVDFARDAALITSEAKEQKLNLSRRLDTYSLSSKHKISEYASAGSSFMKPSYLSSFSATASGLLKGYSMLGESDREKLFKGE